MSWRGKRKGEGYGDDGDGGAKQSKAPRTEPGDSDENVVCEISKNKRVTVRNFNGTVYIDMREFYLKDGKKLPGKKGISLTIDQWKVLCDHKEEINEAFTDE